MHRGGTDPEGVRPPVPRSNGQRIGLRAASLAAVVTAVLATVVTAIIASGLADNERIHRHVQPGIQFDDFDFEFTGYTNKLIIHTKHISFQYSGG
jgi:hypothetical protein